MLAADIASFDGDRFLLKLAELSNTPKANLYIKSISSASIAVVVGVLPAAVAAVNSAVKGVDTARLSESLGHTVAAAPVWVAPTNPAPSSPPTDSSDGGGGAAGAIIGGVIGAPIARTLACE